MADDAPFRVTVDLSASLTEIAERYRFTPLQVQQIGSVAINRTLGTVSTSVVRRLAGAINLRQSDIRESIAIRKATYDRLVGTVAVSRRPVPLIKFLGTTQLKAGVSVLVRLPGADADDDVPTGRVTLAGTFLATMKSGHAGVFERRFEGGKGTFAGPRVPRLPIFERFGLTLTGYLKNAPGVVADEQAKAGVTLAKNVASQSARRLAQQPPDSP